MKKVVSKKEKAVKALKLLFIGQLFCMISLLIELNVISDYFSLFAILSIAGIIIMLVGILKLTRVNKYFLISTLSILAAFLFGVIEAILMLTLHGEEYVQMFNSLDLILSLLSKLLSMLFTYGIIRGCSKAATGNPTSKFGKQMIIANFSFKFVSIVLTIVAALIRSSNPQIANVLSLISMIVSIIAEAYFVFYLFRAYQKAKNTLANA